MRVMTMSQPSYQALKRILERHVAQQQMDFIEAFSALVQNELDRRRSRLIERRFTLSGLPERKMPCNGDIPSSIARPTY